jgi:hypothetical protein
LGDPLDDTIIVPKLLDPPQLIPNLLRMFLKVGRIDYAISKSCAFVTKTFSSKTIFPILMISPGAIEKTKQDQEI